MTALLWLRRDLRLNDHPALRAALDDDEPVVPVFCLDPSLLGGRHASGPRTQFLLECLADLDESLRRRGSGLVVRRGRPEQVLPNLAGQLEASRVFMTGDVGPFATRRDRAVCRELEARRDGGPCAARAVRRSTIPRRSSPRQVTPIGCSRRFIVPGWSAPAGRSCRRRARFPPCRGASSRQRSRRCGIWGSRRPSSSRPGAESTRAGARCSVFSPTGSPSTGADETTWVPTRSSRLSPYLHFGCISARELEAQLPRGEGAQEFRRQLCWRDFYAHVLAHFPANARHEFQDRYRGAIRWSRAERRFAAWCEGRTGYPLVDAAMRQLRREGWMHNRARLVVGSFLTKDLGIDWRWGERWFMRLLIDGDEASNNGNWQWIASVGVDPQPTFRRIYNPARQQARFDPDGAYVRRYVPELRDVPDQYLAEPWAMPEEEQRRAGCVIGEEYPAPIVDHKVARREALARYGEAARA